MDRERRRNANQDNCQDYVQVVGKVITFHAFPARNFSIAIDAFATQNPCVSYFALSCHKLGRKVGVVGLIAFAGL